MKRPGPELNGQLDKKVRRSYPPLYELITKPDSFQRELLDEVLADMNTDVNYSEDPEGLYGDVPIVAALESNNEYAVAGLLRRPDLKLDLCSMYIAMLNYNHTNIWRRLLSDKRFPFWTDGLISSLKDILQDQYIRYSNRVRHRRKGQRGVFIVDPAIIHLLHLITANPNFNLDEAVPTISNPYFLDKLMWMMLFKTRDFDGNVTVDGNMTFYGRPLLEFISYSSHHSSHVEYTPANSLPLATLLTELSVDTRGIPEILKKRPLEGWSGWTIAPVDAIILRLFAFEGPVGQQARERSYWNPRTREVKLHHDVASVIDTYLEPTSDARELRWVDRARARIADHLRQMAVNMQDVLCTDVATCVSSYA